MCTFPTHIFLHVESAGSGICNFCSVHRENYQIQGGNNKSAHVQSLSDFKILKFSKTRILTSTFLKQIRRKFLHEFTHIHRKTNSFFRQKFHCSMEQRFSTSKQNLKSRNHNPFQNRGERERENATELEITSFHKSFDRRLFFVLPQMQQICLNCKQPKQVGKESEEDEEINTEKRGKMTGYEL